jgi:hypothetical protein
MRAIRLIAELMKLRERVPQTGEALQATLPLNRRTAHAAAG